MCAVNHLRHSVEASLSALNSLIQTNIATIDTKAAGGHHHNGDYSAITHAHADLNSSIAALVVKSNANESALVGKAASGHDHDADYSTANHVHSDFATAIVQLQALANTLDPDITNVAISLSITNTYEGIIVQAGASPDIYVRRWGFTVKKNGAVVASTSTGADSMLIPSRWGFADDDALEIQARLMTGVSSLKTSDWRAFCQS